ncbi:MAG: hypothetical protein QNJ22_23555 [Desulfosarcinaceae bacterium]|nr:hypothetical protein [Desulfosarcinaceae bacterium]
MTSPPHEALWLTIRTATLQGFLHLLEGGVRLDVNLGGTLADLLCDQIGIPRDYLDGRIQTLFLNAKAVDNVDTAQVTDGAVIALSAAMPGLVGATLRKGGAFSGLRAAISEDGADACAGVACGSITLKLFNLVARELGPDLLERGISLPGSRLYEFLESEAPDDLQIRMGSQTLDPAEAATLCRENQWVGLRLAAQ